MFRVLLATIAIFRDRCLDAALIDLKNSTKVTDDRRGVEGTMDGRREVSAAWMVMFALTAAPGCSREAKQPEQDVMTYAAALTARTSTLTFRYPAGVNQNQLAIAANGSVLIRDRANIGGSISNVGNVTTSSGTDARLGDVWSQASVVLADRTTVTGTVRSAGSIQRTSSVVITGQALSNINIGPFVTRTINVTFPDAADVDAMLEPDQTKSIEPGRYRTVLVKSRARLKLKSGTYYAETLQVDSSGILDLDDSLGPVVLYLAQPFTFRGVVTGSSANPDLFIGVVGSGGVTIEAPFKGTVLAPSAQIVLGTSGATHTGTFLSRDIEVQPDVRIVQRASAALPTCDDGNACTARDVLTGGVCIGQDPVLTGVPESAPGAPPCPGGSAPIGCRGYDCSTGLPTAVWLAAPNCGPNYPTCTASCPATGCQTSRPRTADLVACDCSCIDATGGANFTITLDGCMQTSATCDSLCRNHGTDACGAASSCSFGSCEKAGTGTPRLIGHGICSLGENMGLPQLADSRGTIDAAISRLTITVGPTVTTVPVSGSTGFHFELPVSQGPPGQVVLGSMILTGGTFDFFGRHITSSRLELTQGAIVGLSSLGSGRYSFAIGIAKLGLRTTANVNGIARTFDTLLPATLNGTLDLPARRIDLTAQGALPSGDRIDFQATSRLANLPPVARIAGSSPLVLECTQALRASVALDGSGSSDPEGQALRYQWFRRDFLARDATPVPVARIANPSVTAPIGQNAFVLVVSDPTLASSRAERVVTVVDTVAPTITVSGAQTFNAGAGANAMTVALARPGFADGCDPNARLEAFLVKIDPDTEHVILVPIDPNQVTLPVGNSNILWRVRDASGNTRDAQQVVTITAVGSPGPAGTPVEAPICASPLFPPGMPQAPVEVRVCVVGRINQGVREGSSVWTNCTTDACTEGAIRDLIDQARKPFLPDVAWTLPTTGPIWKRIRDPFPNGPDDCLDNNPAYGTVCLRADPSNAGKEANQLLQDCWASWGLPPPGSPTADTCTRGIILVLGGRPPANLCGVGKADASAQFSSCTDLATVGRNSLGPWAIALDNNFIGCAGNLASLVGHELGHSVGLLHGDGLDNDCDPVWDECDVEMNDGPLTMMAGEESGPLPLFMTDLQRDRARAFARQSVPTIGQFAQNCTAPPPPIAPGDTMGGQAVTGSCSCHLAGGSETAFSFAAFVMIVGTMLRMRRRHGGAP